MANKNNNSTNNSTVETGTTATPETLSPEQEILRKIEYHKNCIGKLEQQLNNLKKPTRKQMTDLLSKVDGLTVEQIAEKLGVSLA